MSARVLIVDDLPANVKLLETKLALEYYDTLSATNGYDALALCAQGACDIVLLDVMMPGIDGFEVCRRLKSDPVTAHLPVVIVTALDQPADRLRGLEAGADDFLNKPIDDTALFTRVRSLVRLKTVTDELRTRALAAPALGVRDPLARAAAETGADAAILLVEDRAGAAERLAAALTAKGHRVAIESDPHRALLRAAEETFDLALVSLDLDGFDGLRLCSQLRSLERTRDMGLIMIGEPHEKARILRGLDFGVNDYIVRPVERNELLARVRTQVRRRRFSDTLRGALQASLDLAVTDDLTGLHNRRYLDRQLGGLCAARAQARGPACLLLDIDRFKTINDTFGHEAGDEVLRAFADRIRLHTRGIDVVARYGGEEVVIVVPDADLEGARAVAERIRARIEATPFTILRGTREIAVTVSIGVAEYWCEDHDGTAMLKRADLALYRAKAAGRNRVETAAAA